MSRFIPCRDMSADQIIQCGYDAMVIVALCAVVAREGDHSAPICGDIAIALDLAGELIAKLHDTVEIHEGLIREARQ